jgi:carbamoyl-phosphate synthase large subunit
MPRRTDIKKILIIGSGPIVIGQGCEFDYSGTQACKALREEGYEVILINSNPATIMTDPEMADRTYVEPIIPEAIAKVIEIERPDALLPTLGGQTGLNNAIKLYESGVLEKYGVEMIGAQYDAIKKAEDRDLFRKAMRKIGLDQPKSEIAYSIDEALRAREIVGLPCVIRPSFTLSGSGGGIAYNIDEFEAIVSKGLALSLNSEILIEESIAGWKEFELEVMRDRKDNCVIICSIENFDPMGVHTGDSITVAPIQTLTDREYQSMRDAAFAIMREIGVETGGSNVQFATDPKTGRMVVIEMNPRVSRSSALASKATGFPIAKIAAKLAVGYTLDEIPNDITKKTPACFEPTIDYCVVKIPRFTFEKFRSADPILTTSMKSVGETMAMGRTFKEALQKALRGLETKRFGLGADPVDRQKPAPDLGEIRKLLIKPNAERVFAIRHAMRSGLSIAEIYDLSKIDPWFLENMREIVDFETEISRYSGPTSVPADVMREAKRLGFSDVQIATLTGGTEAEVRKHRKSLGIHAVFKKVDTCGAEFASETPYFYSTYERSTEVKDSGRQKIMILGGGPNRIGQGIEFDYCCVQASYGLRELGFETIMVNSNPETVSTDFDTSDQLFFEPLTLEDVLNIWESQKIDGCIVQFGGQTPLNLARKLEANGVKIIGTSPKSIDIAEDRDQFKLLLQRLGLRQPDNDSATSVSDAVRIASRIGYPVVVRPSYVLGGRAMEIVYNRKGVEEFAAVAAEVAPEAPILIDKFLENAIEIDVDAISDGERCVIGGIMEHFEEAGIHSGDSTCVLPPYTLKPDMIQQIREWTHLLAKALEVRGLMNIQYAIQAGKLYVLEVNPRASRTAPFVSKAIGISLARLAAKVMAGKKLSELGFTAERWPKHYSVKAPTFPFNRFPGQDILLGPEMKSTGEVMGIDYDLGSAVAKAFLGAGLNLPTEGKVFVSVRDEDKVVVSEICRQLTQLGLGIVATYGTYKTLSGAGIPVELVHKIGFGRPDVLDIIKNRGVGLIINTPSPDSAVRADEVQIRTQAVLHGIPSITTVAGARAAVMGVAAYKRNLAVRALQLFHTEIPIPARV